MRISLFLKVLGRSNVLLDPTVHPPERIVLSIYMAEMNSHNEHAIVGIKCGCRKCI